MNIWAIAWNGPCEGEVWECDPLLLNARLITDDGTHLYARIAFGTSSKSAGIARFAFVHSFVI